MNDQKDCPKPSAESMFGYVMRMQKNIHDLLYVVPNHTEGDNVRHYLVGMLDAFRCIEKRHHIE